MNCPHCGQELPAGVRFCSRCGKEMPASPKPYSDWFSATAPAGFAMPAVQVIPPTAAERGGADGFTEKVVPYHNQFALGAYYTGLISFVFVFVVGLRLASRGLSMFGWSNLYSFFFVVGLVLPPVAVVLGLGLRKFNEGPKVHGVRYAWFGLVMGFLFTLVHYGLFVSYRSGSALDWVHWPYFSDEGG